MSEFAFVSEFGDAIEFIFKSRESRGGGEVGGSQFLDLTWDHMLLTLAATGAAVAVALPLGLWLGHIRKGEFLAISASNVGRAVPSLALIAFFVAYLGTGFANVMVALLLLALPPILTNTYVGVRQADRDSVDAARGVGMSGFQVVRKVELPLALPLIFAGIRTSMVNVVATATIAPLAGVVTLGDPIINVNTYGDDGRLAAAIVVAVLAVAIELLLGLAERAATPTGIKLERGTPTARRRFGRRVATAGAVLALALVPLGCGDDDDGTEPARTQTDTRSAGPVLKPVKQYAGVKLTIGSKNFTEQKVLGEVFAQGFEALGFDVKRELNLGDEKTAYRALTSGDIDAYPEYTGTALLSLFGVKAEDLPDDDAEAYRQVIENVHRDELQALGITPFTSSNEVGLTKEKADELGVTKISDLVEHDQDLTLYGSPECRQRADCLLGLQEVYGLDFKKFTPVAIDLRHEVLRKGQADLSIVFTTDPQIKREQLVLLEDDKGMFPPYNSTLLMRDDAIERSGGGLGNYIALITKGLTNEVMQELNARVDLDKKTPRQVAREYLKESGLIG